MTRSLRRRLYRALIIPAAGALVVLPATAALASSPAPGANLNCVITVTGNITPGVTPTVQTVLVYSQGLSGTADCSGTIDGQTVTGPGTFGIVVEETATCLTFTNGHGAFVLRAPTADGTRTAAGTFEISGPADTAAFTGDLTGNELSAVADVGDCFTTPLTQATTVLGLHVST